MTSPIERILEPVSLPEDVAAKIGGLSVGVTGAGGFIGSHLTRALVHAGANVVAMDVTDDLWRLADLRGEYESVRMDLLDPGSISAAAGHCEFDIVFHLAAYAVQPRDRDPQLALKINVLGSTLLLDAMARTSSASRLLRFVQIGTSHEYGGSDQPISEDHPLVPMGIYGATKAAAMIVGRTRARELGISWTGLRPFVTFGPSEDPEKFVPYVIRTALAGQPIETTDGRQVRDFLYVKDLVAGMVCAAVSEATTDRIVNLASGEGRTLADLLQRIVDHIGGRVELRLGARLRRPDDMAIQVADVSLSRRLIPEWRPKYSIDAAIRETVDWYAGKQDRPSGRLTD